MPRRRLGIATTTDQPLITYGPRTYRDARAARRAAVRDSQISWQPLPEVINAAPDQALSISLAVSTQTPSNAEKEDVVPVTGASDSEVVTAQSDLDLTSLDGDSHRGAGSDLEPVGAIPSGRCIQPIGCQTIVPSGELPDLSCVSQLNALENRDPIEMEQLAQLESDFLDYNGGEATQTEVVSTPSQPGCVAYSAIDIDVAALEQPPEEYIQPEPSIRFSKPTFNIALAHRLRLHNIAPTSLSNTDSEPYLSRPESEASTPEALDALQTTTSTTGGTVQQRRTTNTTPLRASGSNIDTSVTATVTTSEVAEEVRMYLGGRFAEQGEDIASFFRVPLPYGSAYRELLHIKTIRTVLDALGLSTARNQPSEVTISLPTGGKLSITVADVVMWAHMNNLKNYRHARQRVAKVFAVHHAMKTARSDPSPTTTDEAQQRLQATLASLCQSARLPTIQELSGAEGHSPSTWDAITRSSRPLQVQLTQVLSDMGLDVKMLPNFMIAL
ncbi:hypothetical protein C8Q73DRAFT_680776 [Cubamyces lactineus]|nr:hypothetical protein C8Q73DRAFT_680776 [Cubamyces lactineus]